MQSRWVAIEHRPHRDAHPIQQQLGCVQLGLSCVGRVRLVGGQARAPPFDGRAASIESRAAV
jgi:hypothetical protein